MKKKKKPQLSAAPFFLSLFAGLSFSARANTLSYSAAFPSAENKMAFHRDMRKLLQGPFGSFMEAMEGADDSGRTFWHRIAENKDLAEDLETLLQILSVSMEEKSDPKKYSLAGLKIGRSDLESEPLAQAAVAGDIRSFLDEARALAENASAAEILSVLHGTTGGGGETLYGLMGRGFETVYGDYEDYEIRRRRVEDSIQNIQDYFLGLVWQKDKKGLRPVDVAKKRGNKRGARAFGKTVKFVPAESVEKSVREEADAEENRDLLDMSLRDIFTMKLIEFIGAVSGFGTAAWFLNYNPFTDSWFNTAWKTPVVLWAANKGRTLARGKKKSPEQEPLFREREGQTAKNSEENRRGRGAPPRECQSALLRN